MGGAFFGMLVLFGAYSWLVGFFFIKHDVKNVRTGESTTVVDIIVSYNAMMYCIVTSVHIQ